MIRAVLFDLDNTLIDFFKQKNVCCLAAVKAMLKAGLAGDEVTVFNELMRFYSPSSYEDPLVFEHYIKDKLGFIDYRIVSAAIVAYRRIADDLLIPYAGVRETLKFLIKRGVRIGLVTDAPRLKAWIRLTTAGLSDFFSLVLTLGDSKVKKPSRVPFMKALDSLKLQASDVLFVGDNLERDIVGAKRIGMLTAFARYGSFLKSKPVNNDERPTYVLNEFKDLVKIVSTTLG